jgi:pyroglutamyl-peptidase
MCDCCRHAARSSLKNKPFFDFYAKYGMIGKYAATPLQCPIRHDSAEDESMTRILLTGFEPFGSAPLNPSLQLAQHFAHEGIADAEIITAILPVAARHVPQQIEQLLINHQPDWCVMLGLAEGRAQLSFERIAINLADFRIPDNAGDQPIDAPIVVDGPTAYFSTLPVRAMHQASLAVGTPAELSLTAGGYVCNYGFYAARHACETLGLATRVGFIHLPATPELATLSARAIPSMSLTTMAIGLQAALGVLVGEFAPA